MEDLSLHKWKTELVAVKKNQQIAAGCGKIVEDFGLKAPLRTFFNFRFKKVTIYLKWRLQSSLLLLVVQAKQFV